MDLEPAGDPTLHPILTHQLDLARADVADRYRHRVDLLLNGTGWSVMAPRAAAFERTSRPTVRPIHDPCHTCAGRGCEHGCGQCDWAYAGPDSHRICITCNGTGTTTNNTPNKNRPAEQPQMRAGETAR